MALTSLLFKRRARIGENASAEILPVGAVELDASVEENHVSSNEVTSFPVESGADISDHVRRQPDVVTIRGIVSDTPILSLSLGLDNSLDAYEKLRVMLDDAQFISVVTTLRTYEDMVLQSLQVPRDRNRGHSLDVTMVFRQVFVAQVATISGTSDLGTQNATAVP